jgi:hypothetical protein
VHGPIDVDEHDIRDFLIEPDHTVQGWNEVHREPIRISRARKPGPKMRSRTLGGRFTASRTT